MVTQQELEVAASTLRSGHLVAFPTETVYGLGANAFDPTAVAGIFDLKGRPRFDPLIVHIADVEMANELTESIPALAQALIEQFWPGPMSLVLEKRACVPDIVTAGLPNVAVRCPGHEVARDLIRAAGVPVAAPSANRFGMVSPTTAAHVLEQFGDSAPMILDDGPCRVGVESTVISFVESADGRPVLLRPGGVTLEEIQSAIGPIMVRAASSDRPTSPGQLPSHYAPTTPLILSDDFLSEHASERVGLLTLQRPDSPEGYAAMEVLSEQGCLREAAVNLFSAMRRLDGQGLDQIVAHPVEEVGLGRAIMDRLRRAAAR